MSAQSNQSKFQSDGQSELKSAGQFQSEPDSHPKSNSDKPPSKRIASSRLIKSPEPRSGWQWTLAQILALSASILTAYVWLNVEALAQYSLQVFALCILLYFILKKLNDAEVWELLPTTAVDEMVLVTFAFLILIGATGGVESMLFPLIFVYLFFLSMTMRLPTAIALSLEVLLFLYALSPVFSQSLMLTLVNIPIVMTFFLFARHQYTQAKQSRAVVEIESNALTSYQFFLQQKDAELDQANSKTWGWVKFLNDFVFGFLQPKIDQLIELAHFPQNHNAVKGQLTLVRIELEKLKKHLNHPLLEMESVSEPAAGAQNSSLPIPQVKNSDTDSRQNNQDNSLQEGEESRSSSEIQAGPSLQQLKVSRTFHQIKTEEHKEQSAGEPSAGEPLQPRRTTQSTKLQQMHVYTFPPDSLLKQQS